MINKRTLKAICSAVLCLSLMLPLAAQANSAETNRFNGWYNAGQGLDSFYYVYTPATYDTVTKTVDYDFTGKDECVNVEWSPGRNGWTMPGIADYAEMPFVYDDWVYLHKFSTEYAFGMEFVAPKDGYYYVEAMVVGGDTSIGSNRDWGDGFMADLVVGEETLGSINTDNVVKNLAGDYWYWQSTDLLLKQSAFNLSRYVYLETGDTATLYLHAKTNRDFDSGGPRMVVTYYGDADYTDHYTQSYAVDYEDSQFKPVYADYDYTTNSIDMQTLGDMVYSENVYAGFMGWRIPGNENALPIYTDANNYFFGEGNMAAVGFEFTAPGNGIYDLSVLAGGGDGYANPAELDPSLGDGYGVQVIKGGNVLDKLSMDNVYSPLGQDDSSYNCVFGRVAMNKGETVYIMFTPLATVWGDAIYPTIKVDAEIEYITGDVTGDGIVDVKDLIRLKKYLADDAISIEMRTADIASDDVIDALDIIALRKLILNL